MSDAHPPKVVVRRSKTATAADRISNGLAIAGFIILIIIVVWGLLHLVGLSSGWFSSLFHTSKPATISVSAPLSAESNHGVLVSWKYDPKTAGRYAFLYECADGLQFGIPVVPDGTSTPTLARVTCGTAFTLGNATTSVIVVPILSSTTAQTAHMTMVFVPTDGSAQVHGTAAMQVTPNTALVQPVVTTPTPKPITTPSVPAPRPTSPANLTVQIDAINTDNTGMTVATFDITNTGGSTSGTYYFSANLPTSQPYSFVSQPQTPLAPGAHVVNTLRFTQTVSGLFSVTVSGDANANDNSASEEVVMPYSDYNNYTYSTTGYPVYQY